MNRIKHISTRNLVICDTFDDFSEKLSHIDFSVEDIVGYVLDITKVVYWNNLESIWGIIGFNWTQLNPIPDTEDYDNIWEHLEHVNPDGTNIIEPKSVNPGMGYGIFARTTVPFNTIPKLPDGFRVIAFDGTFDNVASDTIELQRSDWHNVKTLNNLCPPNKSLKADLIGADITSATNLIRSGSNLYFMGDLSNISANQNVLNNYSGTVTVDDDNEGWGIPYNANKLQFKYHYKGTKQARLEYLINVDYNTTRNRDDLIGITSDNNQVYIVNSPYNAGNGYPNVHMLPYKRATDYVNWHDLVAVPEEDKITLTIDYSHYNDTDTFSEHLMGGRNSWYTGSIAADDYSNYRHYMFNPIQYIGLPQDASIEAYNPHIVFANDNWPEYNQQIVEKTKDKFMPHIMAHVTKKCPYVIDCANISNIALFEYGRFFIDDETDLLKEGALDILPVLINYDNVARINLFSHTTEKTGSIKYIYLQSLKASVIGIYHNILLGTGNVLECHTLALGSQRNLHIADPSKTAIILTPSETNGTMNITRGHDQSTIFATAQNYNFIQYATHDIDILKASNLIAFIPNDGYTLYHDLIVSNQSYRILIGRVNIESQFIFIYRTPVRITPAKSWSDSSGLHYLDWDAYYNNQIKKILSGLQPKGDTTTEYKFTIYGEFWENYMTQDERDFVETTCGYRSDLLWN